MNSRAIKTKSRREELLNSATVAIRKHGVTVSMDEIAKVANVPRTILYRYFDDRSGLKKAITEKYKNEMNLFLAEQLDTIRNAVFASDTINRNAIYELTNNTISKVFEFIQNDPEIYKFVTNSQTGQNDSNSLTDFVESMCNMLASYLGDFLVHLKRDSGVAETWAYSIVGMVHFSSLWWLNRQSISDTRVVQYVTDLIVDGITG
jgi:AcrR family transcriptional regulator